MKIVSVSCEAECVPLIAASVFSGAVFVVEERAFFTRAHFSRHYCLRGPKGIKEATSTATTRTTLLLGQSSRIQENTAVLNCVRLVLVEPWAWAVYDIFHSVHAKYHEQSKQ